MTDQTQTTTEPVAWQRADSLNQTMIYSLMEDGWRKGEPRMVNDVTITVQRSNPSKTDIEPIVQSVLSALTTPQPLAIGLDREADEDARLAALANSDDRMVVVSALAAMINGASQIRSMKFKGQCYGRHEVAECDKRISELDRAASRLSKALALAAPADGYVLVPVEPTEAMLDAACDVGPDTNGGPFSHDDARTIYHAMIAACLPAAPTGGRS